MCSHLEIEARIEQYNKECMECVESFQKDGFQFSATMCRYCKKGAELHELLMKASKAEAEFGKLDWNSCKIEKYYNG